MIAPCGSDAQNRRFGAFLAFHPRTLLAMGGCHSGPCRPSGERRNGCHLPVWRIRSASRDSGESRQNSPKRRAWRPRISGVTTAKRRCPSPLRPTPMSINNPSRAGIATAALAVALLLISTSFVDAGPQWRLRRWSSSTPINPTIRSTVAFGTPRAQLTRTRSRYTNSSYRVRHR